MDCERGGTLNSDGSDVLNLFVLHSYRGLSIELKESEYVSVYYFCL